MLGSGGVLEVWTKYLNGFQVGTEQLDPIPLPPGDGGELEQFQWSCFVLRSLRCEMSGVELLWVSVTFFTSVSDVHQPFHSYYNVQLQLIPVVALLPR